MGVSPGDRGEILGKTMNFFEAQEKARRRTKWLVAYFVCAVISIVFSVYVGVAFAMKLAGSLPELWHPELFAVVAGATLLLILGGTAYKSIDLRRGGRAVAEGMGGRPVQPDTGDLKERQLLNIVEEMAIASGTPVPLVYVMDQEAGINAFAAGTEPSNAVIGVTRGCLDLLSRSELQGVIAHEFSHIRNGDMRLNMRLVGFIFGILILMIVGRVLISFLRYARPSKNNKEGGGVLAVLLLTGFVLFLAGAIGGFFARAIQAAVSRQREFLADASAVQFTRDTDGLIGAFKKIGGWKEGARVQSPQAAAMSHMFFAEGGLFRWGMATHPPLKVRIRALDPNSSKVNFDSVSLPDVDIAGVGSPSASMAGFSSSASTQESPAIKASETLACLGDDMDWQLERGQQICVGIDEEWRAASRDRSKAQVLIFAMLLSGDSRKRREQLEGLRQGMGQKYVETLSEWHETIGPLHSAAKIAILDLCIPTLKQLSESEYERLLQMLDWVIAADEKVDLFEFMLQHSLSRHLSSHFFSGKRKLDRGPGPTKGLSESGDILLSMMAWNGRDSKGAAKAFKFAVEGSTPFESRVPSLLPEDSLNSELVLAALAAFEEASPLLKKRILEMCGHAAAEDGVLTNEEAELLRVVADGIGTALPPFLS